MSAVKTTLNTVRLLVSSPTHSATRLARSMDDIRAAQSLRFQVFNLELNEGLEQSYATGLDEDPFDAVCDHLIVEHLPCANIVGTYLTLGANICGPPALDCQFKTIDFLTLLDLETLPPLARQRFLS